MPTAEGLALAIAVIHFLFGFAGSFLPVLPGTFFAWLGIFIHKIWLGDASVPWTFFWIATALTLFCQVLDPACAYLGAKKFGATWRGALGAVLGGIAGVIFFNLAGLVIGPIVGAILFVGVTVSDDGDSVEGTWRITPPGIEGSFTATRRAEGAGSLP